MPSEEEFRRLVKQELSYDAWGRLRDPATHAIYAQGSEPALFLGRGYTGHEHLTWFGLINMNARLYDPVLGRFLSPDPYVQDPEYTQSYNRYSYCLNNPLKYVDEDGEFFWLPVIIGAVIFGTANTVIQYQNGELDNFWDGLNAFVGGAVTGAVIGATWSLGIAGIASGNALANIGGWTIMIGKGINTISTISSTIADPGNAAKIWLGRGYTDGNRNMLGQAWQGISRYTWEGLQTWGGYNYSQLRNSCGKVDKVKYFGGATFAIDEKVTVFNGWEGVSLGNYINAKIDSVLDEDFQGGWIYSAEGLFWHEYGHTFDSRSYGLSYLFSIGIPSAKGAEWTERRANNLAWKYAKKHKYMDEWMYTKKYPLE